MLYKSRFINTYTHNYHNFLRFDLCKLYRPKNNKPVIKVKKIQSRACNKAIMEKLLLKNIKINPDDFRHTQNQKLYKYINKLLQKLKLSGYISRIKIFNFNTPKYKYITFNLEVNPIVKKITIANYSKLKIPTRFLKYVFKEQIGMPKNYDLINNSLKLIYLWYKSRGFAWVNIQLIEQDLIHSNTISFKIMEGTVKDIKLICSRNNMYNPKLVNILELLIKKQLDIYPGDILNIKKVESGIRYLTKLNLIKDCDYIVKRNKTKLIVIIRYNILRSKTDYFYSYTLILENYCKYRQICNLLNRCLSHINLLNKSIIYIQKFCLYSSIIQINQYLSFTYKSFYLNNNINNISINLAVAREYPQFNIIASYPYIYHQTKILSYLIINLYNKIIKSYSCRPFLSLKLNEVNKKQTSNLLTYLNKYIFTLRHNLPNSISIAEKGSLIYSRYKVNKLYIKDYQSISKIYSLKTKIFYIIKLLKYIKYNLIYLQISITYNNLYFRDHLKVGKLLQIQSKLFTCIAISCNNTSHQLNYLAHDIRIKYVQVFNLPKIFAYVYYHTLVIFSECHLLVGSQRYRNILDQSYHDKHTYLKKSYKKNFPLHFFYLFNIEHHISKFKHISTYYFVNCITYSNNQKEYNPYIKNVKNILTFDVMIGSGIQFYIPIKKSPNIRLEYSIDNKGEHFFKLRTDSKYNE